MPRTATRIELGCTSGEIRSRALTSPSRNRRVDMVVPDRGDAGRVPKGAHEIGDFSLPGEVQQQVGQVREVVMGDPAREPQTVLRDISAPEVEGQ